jgi:hypothetical protein
MLAGMNLSPHLWLKCHCSSNWWWLLFLMFTLWHRK